MDKQALISSVVEEVIRQIGPTASTAHGPAILAGSVASSPGSPGSPVLPSQSTPGPASGLFGDVDSAVDQAIASQRQLAQQGLEVRNGICNLLKKIVHDNATQWGQFEINETKIGRLDHKIAKLQLLAGVPGVEFLKTVAHSGDHGIGLDEAAPWGVIGVITPVTHSIPTLTCNAISMIASGNAMVVNPHPSGSKSAALAAKTYNQAIKAEFGIDPLICVIDPPTLRTAEEIFKHPRIPLLVATGGPAVARAAMKQPKRAIVAGPGNPPVVVDETADLDNAAKHIIAGAAFDNNLLCIGEKEVFVVASVFESMMTAMARAGAMLLNATQIQKLVDTVFTFEKDHYAVKKEYVGADPAVLGKACGVVVPSGVDMLFGETTEDNPFVPVEQMMPFLPLVRVADFDQALDKAITYEHGYGHTAVIHSNHLEHITRMGKAMNTTLFVTNGPSTACLGTGGEGYPSYSIATPTGEGVTTPLTFTRFRRISVADALRIV